MRDEQVRQSVTVLQVLHQVEDLRLDRHVQRRHRLVGHDQPGVHRQRARNADALFLPTGEFMRKAAGLRAIQAHLLQQLDNALVALLAGRGHTMHDHGLGDHVLHAVGRIQRRGRILEDHLHVAPVGFEFLGAEFKNIPALVVHAAGGVRHEAQDEPPRGRFSAAGFADQPQRFALLQLERHPAHRLHGARLLEHGARADGKLLLEAFDLEQHRLIRHRRIQRCDVSHGFTHCGTFTCTSGFQQRTLCTADNTVRPGASLRQRSSACEQRGAKVQPGGRSTRSGT